MKRLTAAGSGQTADLIVLCCPLLATLYPLPIARRDNDVARG